MAVRGQDSASAASSFRPVHIVAALAVALTAGALDQVTKWVASASLPLEQPVWLVHDRLSLHLRANPNGAFGMFAGFPEDLRLPVLFALAILALLGITLFTLRTLGWSVAVSISLGLILGGAVANLADRVVRGEVVDFIDISFGGGFRWPTFNLADVAITSGSLILVGAVCRTWFRKKTLDESQAS